MFLIPFLPLGPLWAEPGGLRWSLEGRRDMEASYRSGLCNLGTVDIWNWIAVPAVGTVMYVVRCQVAFQKPTLEIVPPSCDNQKCLLTSAGGSHPGGSFPSLGVCMPGSPPTSDFRERAPRWVAAIHLPTVNATHFTLKEGELYGVPVRPAKLFLKIKLLPEDSDAAAPHMMTATRLLSPKPVDQGGP